VGGVVVSSRLSMLSMKSVVVFFTLCRCVARADEEDPDAILLFCL